MVCELYVNKAGFKSISEQSHFKLTRPVKLFSVVKTLKPNGLDKIVLRQFTNLT